MLAIVNQVEVVGAIVADGVVVVIVVLVAEDARVVKSVVAEVVLADNCWRDAHCL